MPTPTISAPGTFPRTAWRIGYGPAPFTNGRESSWALCAAQRASKAWAAAEASGDWQEVDPTCFKLAVCDKAHEIARAYLAIPLRDRNPSQTFDEWKQRVAGFVGQAFDLAQARLRRAAQTSEHARDLCGHLPDFEQMRALTQAICNIDFHCCGFHPRYYRLMRRELRPVDPGEFGKFDPNLAWERGELKTHVTTYDWATGKRIDGPELVNPRKRKETADGASARDADGADGHPRTSAGDADDGDDGDDDDADDGSSPVSNPHTPPGNANDHRTPPASGAPPEPGTVEPEERGASQPPAKVRRVESRPRSRSQSQSRPGSQSPSTTPIPQPDPGVQLSSGAVVSQAPDVGSGVPRAERAEEQRGGGGKEDREGAEEERCEGGE